MPSLIPENTTTPGTHVLIVGVSSYRHFRGGEDPTQQAAGLDMGQLSGAAHSASQFAAWMLEEYRNAAAPIASLRVLLSPSQDEQIHPRIAPLMPQPATLANLVAELVQFRASCDLFRNNVAVVYIAGHGVQLTKDGAIVLLHDCGSDQHLNLLDASIDMSGVHAGFNHPDTAQTQFWFVDSCRQKPAVAHKFWNMKGGIQLSTWPGVARSNPMFLATITGAPAYGYKGGPTLFNEVLMAGLRGNIAYSPPGAMHEWSVTAFEMARQLPERVQQTAALHGAEQTVDRAGTFVDAVFHTYAQTPGADLAIHLTPADRAAGCIGSLHNGNEVPVASEINEWPLETRVQAGIYTVRVRTPHHAYDRSQSIGVAPPAVKHTVDLA